MVQFTPASFKIRLNSNTLLFDGRLKSPAVGFIGIKLTCDQFPRNSSASSCAVSRESFTPSINAYSNVTLLPVFLK